MFLRTWQRWLGKATALTLAGSSRTTARTKAYRPTFEYLEDRCVPSYAVVDLGYLRPNAIHDASLISLTAGGHAPLWQNGAILDLGTLGGSNSNAYDVNDAGQMVGTAQT